MKKCGLVMAKVHTYVNETDKQPSARACEVCISRGMNKNCKGYQQDSGCKRSSRQ